MKNHSSSQASENAQASRDTHDFSQGSIPKNILSIALPMTLAQLINVLYSVIDRMYIGRLPSAATLALTGIGLTLPIVSLIMAFSFLFSTGGAPLSSIARGEGNTKKAEKIMGTSMTMLMLIGLVITIILYIFKKPMLYLLGASDQTFPYANDYLSVYLLGTVFVMISLGMNSFINAQGFAKTGMFTVLIGAILNIILDPIFIFVLDMGVQGAALATVISQGVSALWVIFFLTGKKAILRLSLKAMVPDLKLTGKICVLGLSGFIMSVTNSAVQMVCNTSLQTWGGDIYVAIMTVLNSVREIISMPVNGLSNGAQPILGFNYGARKYGRVRDGIKFMSAVGIIYTLAAWGLVFALPEFFIRIFNNDPTLLTQGVPALRLYFFGFFMMALQFCGQSVFVALGRARHAVFFSLLRKAIIVIPLTLILPYVGGLGINGIFLAEPISNFIGGLACFGTMLVTVYRKLKKEEQASLIHEA